MCATCRLLIRSLRGLRSDAEPLRRTGRCPGRGDPAVNGEGAFRSGSSPIGPQSDDLPWKTTAHGFVFGSAPTRAPRRYWSPAPTIVGSFFKSSRVLALPTLRPRLPTFPAGPIFLFGTELTVAHNFTFSFLLRLFICCGLHTFWKPFPEL